MASGGAASSGAIRSGRAFVEFFADDTKLRASMKKIERRLHTMGQSIRQAGVRLAGAGLALATPLAIATKIFADFDDRMRAVRAVTGATEDQFRGLTEEAKRLGRTTSYSASQVAEAMIELGRAGFGPEEILASTDAVLALARSTSTELPRATEIAGAALRGFNLEAGEMDRVADVLTATANKSAQTLEDLFEALKPVAPIAAEAGESIEEVASAIGVLANNGIKGSLAGNSLARAYKNLSDVGKQRALRAIGVEAVDADGNLRPLVDIINDLAKATASFGTARRLSLFEELFGRGQASALKLASSGRAFDQLKSEIVASAGLATRTAEEMDAGIGGSFRKLLSAVEGVAIEIGSALAPVLTIVIDRVAAIATAMAEWIRRNPGLIVAVAGTAAAMVALGSVLVATGIAIQLTAISFGLLGTAAGLVLSPLGLILAASAAQVAVWAAVAAWALNATGALQRLSASARGIGSELMASVRVAVGALKRGDIETAAKILWGELRIVWMRGSAWLSGIWDNVMSTMMDISTNSLDGIRATFLDFVGWVLRQISDLVGKAADLYAKIYSKIPVVGDRMAELIRAGADQVQTAADDFAGGAEIAAQDYRDDIAERKRLIKEGKDAIRDMRQQEIDEAREELDKLIRDSATKNERLVEETVKRVEDAIESVSVDVKPIEQAGGKLESSGTFAAAALGRLFTRGEDAQKRTADATEETADNTRRLLYLEGVRFA